MSFLSLRNLKSSMVLPILAAFPLAAAGCGKGTKFINKIAFDAQTQNNELQALLDVQLNMGSSQFPSVSFPLYDPKNPSRTYGELRLNGADVQVALNVTQALGAQPQDGRNLPNGSPIPMALPSTVNPIAIPAFNSDSLVYVAVNGANQVMIGVAIAANLGVNAGFPINGFMPFTFGDIQASVGLYTGPKSGIGVFALRDVGQAPTVVSASKATLASASALSARAAVAAPRMALVETKSLSSKDSRVLQKAYDGLGRRVRVQ